MSNLSLPDDIRRRITAHQYAPANSLQSYDVLIPDAHAAAPPRGAVAVADHDKIWVVFVHGGYFCDAGVDSTSFYPALAQLVQGQHQDVRPYIAGYATVNYRLAPSSSVPQDPATTPKFQLRDARWPEHMQDVVAAIAHVQQHYGVGENYLLVGHSVGATMAMLATLANARPWTHEGQDQHGLRMHDGSKAEEPGVLTGGHAREKIRLPVAVLGVSGIYDFGLLHQSFPLYVDMTRNAIHDPRDDVLASPARYSLNTYEDAWATTTESRPSGERLLVLAHSRDDGLVDWKQVDAMSAVFAPGGNDASRVRDAEVHEGVASPSRVTVRVLELQGRHDEIWSRGDELARAIRETITAITSRASSR